MLKVDLHTHTADDPQDWIPYSTTTLIDRAAALGFDALAITLHDRQLDLSELSPYASDRGIVLIPGIERTVEGRHVLLLNFSRAAESVRSFEDIAQLKMRERGLVVAPHPFFPDPCCLGSAMDAHAGLFDAVEWNALFTRWLNFNRRAVEWASRRGLPVVANGDVHRLHQLGTCYSLVEALPDAGAICEAVRAGRVEIRTDPVTLFHVVRTIGSLKLGPLRRYADQVAARYLTPRAYRPSSENA